MDLTPEQAQEIKLSFESAIFEKLKHDSEDYGPDSKWFKDMYANDVSFFTGFNLAVHWQKLTNDFKKA